MNKNTRTQVTGPVHRVTVVVDVYGSKTPTEAKDYVENAIDLDGLIIVGVDSCKQVAVRR